MSSNLADRKVIISFFTHTALVQVITFVLRPTATYRAIELDVDVYWLGLLGASFAVVPLVLALPSGQAVDRFGEGRVMLVGSCVVMSATLLFTFGASTISGVVVASVLLGLGHLCSVVGQQAMVANNTSASSYDRAFGHYTFAASLGQALGPGLIILSGGREAIPVTHTIFLWSLALSAALVVLSRILLTPAGRANQKKAASEGSVRDLLRTPGLLHALTVSCVVLAAVDITLVYLPALGAERGIAAGTVGILLAVRAAASMTSRLFLGSLVARFRRERVLMGSIAMAAGGLAVSAVPLPVWVLLSVVAVLGFGLGAGQPITMSWLAEIAPPGLRGRAMSLRLTGNRLGQVVLPSMAGLLAVSAGPSGVLLLTAGGLAAVGVSARSINRSKPSE